MMTMVGNVQESEFRDAASVATTFIMTVHVGARIVQKIRKFDPEDDSAMQLL